MALYAITDVETTGTNAQAERITEIAIYIHDGKKIVDEMHTLINPERKIPYRITQITGINDAMVRNAPPFYEVARQIVELTQECVFVAHNAAFDYNFIRQEFRRLGYTYKREQVCTVKLSRKLLPGHSSYSLGRLCDDLNINIESRHRANGDALATVKLFEKLLEKESRPEHADLHGLDTGIPREMLEQLPKETGVYYFHDDKGEVIYTGKSTNIRSRILSHLSNNNTKKAIEMRSRATSLSYEITGSELAALLFEAYEIKRLMPIFNRALRRKSFNYAWFSQTDEQGYIRLSIEKTDNDRVPILSFSTSMSARNSLFALAEQHQLCQKLCGLYQSNGACFQHSIKECRGACIGEESPQDYNKRLINALEPYRFKNKNFIILEPGRTDEEQCIILIQNGKYMGFGYAEKDAPGLITIDEIKNIITSYPDNRDIQQIIKSFLRHNDTTTKLL